MTEVLTNHNNTIGLVQVWHYTLILFWIIKLIVILL